jgi:cation:H+ antiporter
MWRKIAVPVAAALPAVILRVAGIHPSPEIAVVVFGAGVVASAVLLAWAAEAAEMDISGSLAIAILALIAVLPEYAVDLYFAYTAGARPEYTQFAAANMTGSNRLLIGIGWPLVAFVSLWAIRRGRRAAPDTESGGQGGHPPALSVPSSAGQARARRSDGREMRPGAQGRDRTARVRGRTARVRGRAAVTLPGHRRVELGFLALASAYAFVIPVTRSIAWYDAVILLGLFGLYLFRVTREGRGEPELIGVAAEIGSLPRRCRRLLVTAMFIAAAAIVVSAAEPFANGLVDTGRLFGIDQFLLVQWLAPLSSEAPELIVATLFAWRLRSDDSLGTLLSAKVNQWTLLVGSLFVAYALGGGRGPLPLDDRQTEEFLLTSAQALLAFAVLADLTFGAWEAAALLGLFALQFPFPSTEVRLVFSAAYLVLGTIILVRKRRALAPIARTMTRWSRAT